MAATMLWLSDTPRCSRRKVLFDTTQEMELLWLPLVRTPFCVIVKLVIMNSEDFVNLNINSLVILFSDWFKEQN